ncbi:MAG: DUF192 domain-containing protein, partial [Elusimicrobiota bacterium]
MVAENFFNRFIGLMFKNEFPFDSAIYFPKTIAIHTFFMNFSIDVIWINKYGRILALRKNLRPWRVAIGF